MTVAIRRNILILSSLLLAAAIAAPAFAQTAHTTGKLKQVATMTIPGKTINGFDISWVDQRTQRYYLADRDNSEVDIFDGRTDKFIGSIPGFVGPKKMNGKEDFDISGPAGVLTYGDTAWVGDGDSTAKEVDLKTMKIIATVPTGGKHRFDEIAYDPKDHVLAGGNGDEDPPFAALVSTTQHKLIAQVPFKSATDGLEAPAYDSANGMFYFSVPEFNHDPKQGGVAIISPQGKLVKILPVEACHPSGIVFGPHQHFLLGCSASGREGMPAIFVVMNARTGKVAATIHGAGGADEVAYSSKNHEYYTASAGMGGVFVIDALTNKLVEKIPTGGHAHSVAASDVTGKVFVPEGTTGGCGCIRVFAPAM
ncbi:MAG TPA: cytochrome C nitrite reductase [Candidatus Dormibacteraeota bacterium]|nr:cytochrome C nitrite reductase [Candidatus Dormibacteraeota bacterium]